MASCGLWSPKAEFPEHTEIPAGVCESLGSALFPLRLHIHVDRFIFFCWIFRYEFTQVCWKSDGCKACTTRVENVWGKMTCIRSACIFSYKNKTRRRCMSVMAKLTRPLNCRRIEPTVSRHSSLKGISDLKWSHCSYKPLLFPLRTTQCVPNDTKKNSQKDKSDASSRTSWMQGSQPAMASVHHILSAFLKCPIIT